MFQVLHVVPEYPLQDTAQGKNTQSGHEFRVRAREVGHPAGSAVDYIVHVSSF